MHGTGGQVLHLTPSRFTKVSQNRTWNTGNGSPDAICFSVDRSGVMIAGVTVYGGVGNEWHYELELLDDVSLYIFIKMLRKRRFLINFLSDTDSPKEQLNRDIFGSCVCLLLNEYIFIF